MRILVASSDASTRNAIGMLIDTQPDLELVGRVGDIADLLLSVKQVQPDLVVLDWEVLGKKIGTLQELLELFEQPPAIIALSVHEQARHAAFDSGVVGFAYKGDSPERLLSTIRGALSAKGVKRKSLDSHTTQEPPNHF